MVISLDMRYKIVIAVIFTGFASSVFAEKSALSAFEVMERVNAQLKFLQGLNKLQFTITSNKGNVTSYKVSLFQKEDKSLFLLDSISRGRLLKILYNDSGQNIYVYDVERKILYHKRAQDRFDSILNSGFYFIDLNNSDFLDNYTPKFAGMETRENSENLLRIENIPLDPGAYGKLNVLVSEKNNYALKRIDYFDRAGVLIKSMELTENDFPVITSDEKKTVRKYLIKWQMMDMSKGTISVLEFLVNDQKVKLDNSLFEKQNIEK